MVTLAFWIVVWVVVIAAGLLMAGTLLGAIGRAFSGSGGQRPYTGEQLERWEAKARREDVFCWIMGACTGVPLLTCFLVFAPWGS